MEEVKLAIKPHYNKGRINKDEYKDIMRRAVPKVRPSVSENVHNSTQLFFSYFAHRTGIAHSVDRSSVV